MLGLCRRHRLPKPEVNVWIGPFLVDCLWRRQRLVVEVDSWEHHQDRQSFESDRARDPKLTLMGFRVVRSHDDPAGVAVTLRALLRV